MATEECNCPLCDPKRNEEATKIAQDILITKRPAGGDDQVVATAFIMAAAALAKTHDFGILQFATLAAKAYNLVETVSDKELN